MPAKPRPHSPGNGDGGDPPPPRLRTTGGDAPSIVTAQAELTNTARDGRRGTKARAAGGGPGTVNGPAAATPLRPPHAGRHNLNNVKLTSRTKDKNTIVLPGTDVTSDLADISAGRGTWDSTNSRYRVNGRTYGVEPGGTTFPVDGPGFVKLDRSQYKVLKNLIGNDGDIATTREALRQDPSVSESDWTMALEVFQHHKSYRGGA